MQPDSACRRTEQSICKLTSADGDTYLISLDALSTVLYMLLIL